MTPEDAAVILLERALKTTDPTVSVDAWGPEDWADNLSANEHRVYANDLKCWVDPHSSLLRVEAGLEATWEVPASAPLTFASPASYFYGDRYVLESWKVSPTGNRTPGFANIEAVGWVPELLGNPYSRSRASEYEAPGHVVAAVSAVLEVTPNAPWSANFANVNVRADQVRNEPNSFLVRVSVAGAGIASSVVLATLTPRLNKLVGVRIGTLTGAIAHDTLTARLTFG